MALLVVGLAGINTASEVIPHQRASIILAPLSDTYDINEALKGAVEFTRSKKEHYQSGK